MDFNNGHGTTSLLVSGTEENVWRHRVEVGFLDTQYFQLILPYHRSNASLTLNTVQTTVQPGLNVSYAAGSNVRVQMVAAKRIYEGAYESRGDIDVTGGYLDPDTGKVDRSYYSSDWHPHIHFDIKSRDIDDIRATLSFNNSEGNVNGWFRIGFEAEPEGYEPEPVLISLKDYLWIMVHEDTNPGPFADGFVSFTSRDTFGCAPGYHRYCRMECEAHGNDIASLHIYKHGHRELGHAEETHDYAERFYASVDVSVDVDADFAGQYDCVASDSAGREVAYPIQLRLERPAEVQDFFNETLENGDVKLTCVANGSAPLTTDITLYDQPVARIADYGMDEVEVVAAADTITLTKATRTVTGDNNDVLYTVEFQAVARPDFHWLTYYVSHPEAVRAWRVVLDAGFLRVCLIQPHFLRRVCLATEKVGEMDFNNGQGTTSLLVSGTEEDVWGHRVEVGFLDTQYFQLLLPYHKV
nr:hypothetical protein BaRGS_020851 [Batillaria attramentaria]